ncbi:Cof-type HAD-IIB family hydrolase [Amphibacillus jilinensis]|uniref:Cof-type HAD-IIB family hydrolase n=1 Tax=Amphibacillus jilinensis TaxID=1216008 RepID=UPI00030A62FF|nr:Cof-type HAD-IIB family hydrolase [Amphibacillus jilinensis]
MNKELKLVALDLDGTLVSHGGERATEATVTAIKKAQQQGVEVVISTGRHRSTSLPLAEQLGVNYMITLNGGEIWTRDGELLKRQAIDQATVEKIIEIHKQNQTFYWLVSHEKVYREVLPDNYLAHQWIKFGFDVEDDTIRTAMQEQFRQLPTIELSNSSLTNIELNAKGTHKAAAIDFLLQQLDLDFSQVMAVGDSINDLKMIEAAGVGVAMGNAQALVKERADWVTDELDQDGAAHAIEHFITDNRR